MTERDEIVPKCRRCKDVGWASQYRTYGDQQYHGYYYEPCDKCNPNREPPRRRLTMEDMRNVD